MARDQKAQSQLRSESLAPVTASDFADDPSEEYDDEEELEVTDEDELWEDEESFANEDVIEVEGATDAAIQSVGRAAVIPAAYSTSNRFDSFKPREIGGQIRKKNSKPRAKSNGLKKSSLKRSKELDMPPTPLGCEWRDAGNGWSLWRCWSEGDNVIGGKYRKERYAGYLSREAWGVMKQYEYETFIAVIGRRFRRHGGR
ncbi:MAG: hypothetical protein ABI977_24710 [Acidobacteriota bacterium]